MQPALAWLLAGLLLVVVELMTGTFYLLILGIAAGIGSLIAFLDLPRLPRSSAAFSFTATTARQMPLHRRTARMTSARR
jgi:membrane protein implicated in regulation of membrane protease activity